MSIYRTGLTLVRLQDEATFSGVGSINTKIPQEGCLSIESPNPTLLLGPNSHFFHLRVTAKCLHLQLE